MSFEPIQVDEGEGAISSFPTNDTTLSEEERRHQKMLGEFEWLVPTGATLLNLALSDNALGGYKLGSMVNVVGDSSAGKTFLCWNMFAEVVADPFFDDYVLVYDDAEGKLHIPIRALFGPGVLERVEYDEDNCSDTIEDFYGAVRELLQRDKPFIYVLDSFDSLSDIEEQKKTMLRRDYPAKPRLASEMFRKICGQLRHTRSLLVVVSQVRENIGVTFGEKKTRSGGRALRHYSLQEYWLAVKSHVKRRDREVGVNIVARVKKNHLTGKLRQVEFPLYHDYGVDDTRSMIEWLIAEGFWRKPKGKQVIETGGDFIDASMDKLIHYIEEESVLPKLVSIVAQCWAEVERSIRTDRRPRYHQGEDE